MNEQLRRQIVREFPELAAGYHLPVMAEVTGTPDAPVAGGINDNYRPRLAVNVELLTTEYKQTGITLDAVPVSIMGGGDERGIFAMPKRGTIVELAWLCGSPERPFVRSVLGDRQALPNIDACSMSWQASEESYQRVDAGGNWHRKTDGTVIDESAEHQQRAARAVYELGEEVRRILEHSTEDIDGKKQIEATAIHLLSATVLNLLATGSINTAAAENITAAAAKKIAIDAGTTASINAAESISATAGTTAEYTAAESIQLVSAKVKVGNDADNLLALVSEALQAAADGFTAAAALTVTTTAPGSPTGTPLNAAEYTAAASAISTAKAKIDGMTL